MAVRAVLSRPVSVESVPPTGMPVAYTVSDDDLRALAAAYDLRQVAGFSADLLVERTSSGARVTGEIDAAVTQSCVVSLEPVDDRISESIDVTFSTNVPEPTPNSEVEIDPDEPDPPDFLEGDTIDLGALVEEHFALALNPYPRKPDVQLEDVYAKRTATREDSPFAALADLDAGPAAGRENPLKSED